MNDRDFLAALIDHKVACDGVWMQVCRFVLDPGNPVIQLQLLLREIEKQQPLPNEYNPFDPAKNYPASPYSHKKEANRKKENSAKATF